MVGSGAVFGVTGFGGVSGIIGSGIIGDGCFGLLFLEDGADVFRATACFIASVLPAVFLTSEFFLGIRYTCVFSIFLSVFGTENFIVSIDSFVFLFAIFDAPFILIFYNIIQ